MSAPRIRRLVCLLLALAAAGLVAARIWWVNTELPAIPLEYYGEGEWVPLEGAYQDETETEGTEGYSVMVEGAHVTTYDEYLADYGGGGTVQAGTYGNARCVVDLTLRIKNDGTTSGGLNMFESILVPERGNEYLICDITNEDSLWPQVQKGAGSVVNIQPGTECVVHVPYVFNGTEEAYYRDVLDKKFTLLVSRMPVRKMIYVTVE